MTERQDMAVRFWGVRGSIASPGPDTIRYGANTACVEVRCGEHLFICDAGTGIRRLGQMIADEAVPADVDLLCSHTHLDHICGFPFFAPCYRPGGRIRVWGATDEPGGIETIFRTMMTPPLFPDVIRAFAAEIDFHTFERGEVLSPRAGVSVRTARLNHPGGATGYRIEWRGKAVAYITDNEHGDEGLDAGVLALADGADVLIYDANYTDDDYPAHRGWGHSTWQEAVKIARGASVGKLVIFHHDPSRSDAALDDIAAAAARALPGTVVAREGLDITI